VSDTFITVVSGLPRSGTSLMMQMLSAGGMPLLTDSHRPPDCSNPRGYFEYERVKHLAKDSDWLGEARGQAIKIVCPLVKHLPLAESYRVVLMRRAIMDIVASQRIMLTRLGKSGANLSDARLANLLSEQLNDTENWIKRQTSVTLLAIDFQTALLYPVETARVINGFLGGRLAEDAMAGTVVANPTRSMPLPVC